MKVESSSLTNDTNVEVFRFFGVPVITRGTNILTFVHSLIINRCCNIKLGISKSISYIYLFPSITPESD